MGNGCLLSRREHSVAALVHRSTLREVDVRKLICGEGVQQLKNLSGGSEY
jgi:hypothetical protein